MAAIAGMDARLIAHKRITQVTWTTDIAPILQRRCTGCHTADGFGPKDLRAYNDVKREGRAIREAVLERRRCAAVSQVGNAADGSEPRRLVLYFEAAAGVAAPAAAVRS